MKDWMKWVRWSAILVAFLFLFPSHVEAAQNTPIQYQDPYNLTLTPSLTLIQKQQQNANSQKNANAKQNTNAKQNANANPNATNQQLIPAGCNDQPSKFEGCPSSYYIIDYVGIRDIGTFEFGKHFGEAINWAFNFLLDLLWGLYTIIIVLVIYFFRFSYSLDVMSQLTPVLQDVSGKSGTYIWGSLYAFLFVVSFIYVLMKFLQLQRKEGYMVLFRNIVIVAFASFFLSHIPTFVAKVSKGTGLVSDYILAGFLSVTPKDTKQETQGQNLEELAKEQKNRAVDTVSDTLWNKLYFEPYVVLEFGSVNKKTKNYVNQLFNYGKDDENKRKEWFWGKEGDDPLKAKVDPRNGTANYDDFKMVTAARIRTKFIYEIISIPLGIVFGVFLVILCWKILKWFFVGIGRALFSVFALLSAMWPERSFRDVIDWLLWTGFAFFMRIFLACVLAIGLTIFAVLQNVDLSTVVKKNEYEFLVTIVSRGLLSLACLVAIWMVMKEVQAQMEGLVGAGAREPDASDFMNANKAIARRMVNAGRAGFGLIKGGLKTVQGGLKTAGAIGNASLTVGGLAFGVPQIMKAGRLKNFAEMRRKSRLRRKAEKAMEKMGLDPYSRADRSTFFSKMKEMGKANKATELLSYLPSISKDQDRTHSQEFPELKSTLSSSAQKVFKDMSMNGYNPFDSSDREKYLQKNPMVKEVIEEIGKWVELPDEAKLTNIPIIPPQEPELHTPESAMYYRLGFYEKQKEYDEVADRLIKQRQEEVKQKVEEYKSLPFYKRWFTPKPEFKNPTQEEINKAYFEHLQKKNKK